MLYFYINTMLHASPSYTNVYQFLHVFLSFLSDPIPYFIFSFDFHLINPLPRRYGSPFNPLHRSPFNLIASVCFTPSFPLQFIKICLSFPISPSATISSPPISLSPPPLFFLSMRLIHYTYRISRFACNHHYCLGPNNSLHRPSTLKNPCNPDCYLNQHASSA